MRKLIALATVTVASAVLAVPAFAATKTVNVGDIWFVSKAKNHSTISVPKGTKVTFKWVGRIEHIVQVKSGPIRFKSPTKKAGTYSKVLSKAGTYKVFCSIHTAAAQSMTIKVT